MDPRMAWQSAQSTERASVRLAARNTSQPPQPQMIPLQYPQYMPTGGIALFPYPPQYMQQQPQKRTPDIDEEEAAPKKKARTVRTKADGTPGLSRSVYFKSEILNIRALQSRREVIRRKKETKQLRLLLKMVRITPSR